MDLYNYKAHVIKVIDGDTVKLDIDLGFRVHWTSNCRIAGIDSPEMGSEKGEAAKEFLKSLLPEGKQIVIKSLKLDKYGRPVFDSEWESGNVLFILSQEIIKAGHAVKY